MTIERAVDNAIASTEMEGFTITEKHRELIMKLMKKEIPLAIARLRRYTTLGISSTLSVG